MATLKDVAREAGLTVGTVSRVLNNRGYISEQTRAKVYEVMKELNYHPNEMARSLSKQKSNTIGLIVPHIVHPYFSKMINCIEASAYEQKYKLLLFSSLGKEEKEDDCVELCKSNRVDGIILCSNTFHTEKFKNLGCPLITIERFLDVGTAGVKCDNYQGGVLATEHLIAQGCRHLIHFAGPGDQKTPADDRQTSFEDVCRRQGVEYVTEKSRSSSYNQMNYYDLIDAMLEKYPQTDGIFASSDVIAAQAIQVCRKRNISVPGEMKIVGFDDVTIAELTMPRITTIHQPVKEMAEMAVSLMAKAIEGEMVATQTMFPVSLVIRESS